jgi:hypothetical protein
MTKNTPVASVQDACLLSMLRVAADCDEVPPEVLILVKDLAQHSRRHIHKVSYAIWCHRIAISS